MGNEDREGSAKPADVMPGQQTDLSRPADEALRDLLTGAQARAEAAARQKLGDRPSIGQSLNTIGAAEQAMGLPSPDAHPATNSTTPANQKTGK